MSNERLYQCRFCKYVFGVAISFELHKDSCKGTDLCTSKLNPFGIEVELRNDTNSKGKNLHKAQLVTTTFQLACCEEVFTNFKHFNAHKFLKHEIEFLVCGLCNMEHDKPKHLYSHYKCLHFHGIQLGFRYQVDREEKIKPLAKQRDLTTSKEVTKLTEVCTAEKEGILCQCSICCKKAPETNDYSIRNTFKCKLCKFRFPSVTKLNIHVKCHVGRKEFLCNICSQTFTCSKSLEYHSLSVHSSEPNLNNFTCHICFKQMAYKRSLLKHIRTIHLKQNQTKRVSCPHCGKSLSSKTLAQHIKGHSLDSLCFCYHCDKRFFTKSALTAHIVTKHLPQESVKCDLCEHSAPNILALRQHKAKKHSTKIYGCEICGKMFPSRYTLENSHMTSHTDDRSFVCSSCGKTFKRYVNLRQHMVSHSSERSHVCDICGLTFRLRTHVKQHMAVHGIGDNHKCLVCNRSFARKRDLNLHMTFHDKGI